MAGADDDDVKVKGELGHGNLPASLPSWRRKCWGVVCHAPTSSWAWHTTPQHFPWCQQGVRQLPWLVLRRGREPEADGLIRAPRANRSAIGAERDAGNGLAV